MLEYSTESPVKSLRRKDDKFQDVKEVEFEFLGR